MEEHGRRRQSLYRFHAVYAGGEYLFVSSLTVSGASGLFEQLVSCRNKSVYREYEELMF